LKKFHLSNLHFSLQSVEETFEAANVVIRIRKSNRQYYNKQTNKKHRYKQWSTKCYTEN